jgi:hypothetical protein
MSPAQLQATLKVAAKLLRLKALHCNAASEGPALEALEGNHAIVNDLLCQVGAHIWQAWRAIPACT